MQTRRENGYQEPTSNGRESRAPRARILAGKIDACSETLTESPRIYKYRATVTFRYKAESSCSWRCNLYSMSVCVSGSMVSKALEVSVGVDCYF